MGERVVVTGLGLATALGIEVEENWQKLLNGVSGITALNLPHSSSSPIRAAGQIDKAKLKKMEAVFACNSRTIGGKKTVFAHWAAVSALRDAGLVDFPGNRNRWGLFSAEGIPTVSLMEIAPYVRGQKDFNGFRFGKEHGRLGHTAINKTRFHETGGLLSEKLGLQCPNGVITSACASATQAIGLGFRAIRRGDATIMVVGGGDSMIDPVGLMFFVLLTAASVSSGGAKTACRPFDLKRNGLVVGEGAGFLVLEALSHAEERGAHIYAEMAGYGTTMDAFRATAPDLRGVGAAQAMKQALEDAGLGIGDIDYINAHGTGTKQNDISETLAVKTVFGNQAKKVCISSSKSMIGHLMAASGGPECIYTVLTVMNDEIHPTISLRNPDPKCDLDYVPNIKRKRVVRNALSNSFGFGGQNATIALRKYA